MLLLFVAAFGIAVACELFRIAPLIWVVPLLAASILGCVFVVRHGDRIVEAAPTTK